MPQIGPLEILIVGVLALLVFGPEKLPEMGRSLGKGLAQMKKMASEVKSEFDLSLEDNETADAPASTFQPSAREIHERVDAEDVPPTAATA